MNDIRKHINLFESINMEAIEDAEMVDEAVEEVAEEIEENLEESDFIPEEALVEFDAAGFDGSAPVDAGLEGIIDPRQLAKLLPEVDDVNRFATAVRKVQKGDIARLSIAETRQLAKAFISVLRDDNTDMTKLFQKLRQVHAKTGE